MNRLWVRLSIAIGLFIVILMIIIALAAQVLVNNTIRESFLREQLNRPNGLVEKLASYYQENDGWGGVDALIKGAQSFDPSGQSRGAIFVLEDAQHNTIFHSGNPSKPIPPNYSVIGVPIRVDRETVGHLQAATRKRARSEFPRFRRGPEQDILEWLSGLLIGVAIIGTIVGLGISVLLSRSLTAPLSRVAVAARAIGGRDFTQRIDVSGSDEIQEVAHAFNEMASGLEEAETLRRNLMADVAHELRTPLSVLQGNLRAILDDVYPLEKAEITRLYDQTRLLNRLVNDLREVAQAEAGQLQLSLAPLDLNTLIGDTVNGFMPVAEAANVGLHRTLADNLPAIPLDATRIRQVFNNLLNNALQHTPEGGTITVASNRDEDHAIITIADTGQGIEPEHIEHIFDRFYRTDSSRARNSGGSGLGLAIVRAIVEAHQGSITAESSGTGLGTTFRVRLPTET